MYKGGTIERDICEELDIRSWNIEQMDLAKANCHDPREEVLFYYKVINQDLHHYM